MAYGSGEPIGKALAAGASALAFANASIAGSIGAQSLGPVSSGVLHGIRGGVFAGIMGNDFRPGFTGGKVPNQRDSMGNSPMGPWRLPARGWARFTEERGEGMGKRITGRLGGAGDGEGASGIGVSEAGREEVPFWLGRARSILEDETGFLCYLVGVGAGSSSMYKSLKRMPGVEVVYRRSLLPGGMEFMSFFIAAYSGIVAVRDASKVNDVFWRMSRLSTVGVYVIPEPSGRSWLESMKSDFPPGDFHAGCEGLEDYFIYYLDANNSNSETGAYRMVSSGGRLRRYGASE